MFNDKSYILHLWHLYYSIISCKMSEFYIYIYIHLFILPNFKTLTVAMQSNLQGTNYMGSISFLSTLFIWTSIYFLLERSKEPVTWWAMPTCRTVSAWPGYQLPQSHTNAIDDLCLGPMSGTRMPPCRWRAQIKKFTKTQLLSKAAFPLALRTLH